MKKTFLLLSMLLAVTACASDSTNSDSVDTRELVCEKAASTGTHMKKKRCVSKEQAAAERIAAQEYIRKNVKGGTHSVN